MTDDELIEQVRAGDAAAFGELVERHRGAVYRAALAALGTAWVRTTDGGPAGLRHRSRRGGNARTRDGGGRYSSRR